jgi:beta-glucanase (GH16 family)
LFHVTIEYATGIKMKRLYSKYFLVFLLPVISVPGITGTAFAQQLPPGSWTMEWQDEFEGDFGARPSDHWFFFNAWGAPQGKWRDAYYTEEDAYLNGNGKLALRARLINDSLKTSTIQTYDWAHPKSEWTTFGPGRYFEASIKLTGFTAGGLWTAFWLFAPQNTYDGDPDTGMEIDIMEYVVAYGADGSWIKDLPEGNSLNYINVAAHWGRDKNQSEGKFLNADNFGIDIRDGQFHTFGLKWLNDSYTFYIDGDSVHSITKGISSFDGHALILSVEYDAPPDDAWGLNENVTGYTDSLPGYVYVDYVRVYKLDTVTAVNRTVQRITEPDFLIKTENSIVYFDISNIHDADFSFEIFGIDGIKVQTPVITPSGTGCYRGEWHRPGRNTKGIYLAVLKTGGKRVVKKFAL